MYLGSPDHDPIALPFHDVDIHIRVFLLAGPLHPVPFDVRLGTTAHQVLFLKSSKPFHKVLMILGGPVVLLVGLIRNVIDGIGSIDSHTPLYTTSGHLTKSSGHILLLMQVLLTLMNMTESIDLLSGEMRFGCAQTFVFWVGRVIESQPHGINRGHLYLIIPGNLFAVHINISPHLPQSFDV